MTPDRLFRFEDYTVGERGMTGTRTVTEADIVNFGCLIADYSQAHMDRHFMSRSIYGERVAHGLLGSCLATGMLYHWSPRAIGRDVRGSYFQSFEANYRKGIKVGDTIHIKWRIAEEKQSCREGFGLVNTYFDVVNQEDIAVYDGKRSPDEKKAGKSSV